MIKPIVANKADPVLYCADCEREFGEDPQKRIGQPFVCPVSSKHLAAVVKPPAGRLWLRIERRIAICAEFSPMRWLVRGGGRAGIYHIIRLFVLLCLLFLARERSSVTLKCLAAAGATFILYDILVVSTYATFVTRFPTHPLRTLILTISSLFQIAIVYAILYRLGSSSFNQNLSFVDALYFSIVTISTVGYGDIHPNNDAPAIKLLVISELVVGFSVVAGLFAIITGWANDRPRGNEPMTMGQMDLQEDERREPGKSSE